LQRELDDEKLGLHTIGLVEAEKSLDRCSEKGWQAQFDKGEDSGSLVGGLRGLDAYRGTEADQGRPKTTGPLFLAESTFGEADQELFKAFRAAWRSPNEGGNGWPVLSSGSLRFVFKLWGAAARFAVKQMLDRVAK
jgi:hypothetical protein